MPTAADSTSLDRSSSTRTAPAHAHSPARRVVVAAAPLAPRPQAVKEGNLARVPQLDRALQPLAPRPRLPGAEVPQEAVLRLQARLGDVQRVGQHGGDRTREEAGERGDPRRLVRC
jgi:hypothetical protein